ncbi:sigma-70 family RNA polymerase sigma factor [Oceanobacillus sp. CAU 1775]
MKALFDSFYNKYHQDLYNYVYYMVKNKTQTEDLIQEIYIRVIKSYDNFRGESSEKTWLFSIARHITYDFFRKQYRQRKYQNDAFDWDIAANYLESTETMPEEVALKNEQIQSLFKYLDQCTIDQKNVIILRFIQGFSLIETAEILNITVSKVKTTQHRGIKLLRQLMEENAEEKGVAEE